MPDWRHELYIGERAIGESRPTYFIADVAANHDGELNRAIDLIHLCAEAGADAAKFQHFEASTIVSDQGFKDLGSQSSHQASWKKSVYDVYDDASIDFAWTARLKEECDRAGIHFFTSPYSIELVDKVDPYVPAYKIGSGDITWTEIISHISGKGKPVLLASGASTQDEVDRALDTVFRVNAEVLLMQCNTNYTAHPENFKYIALNVLKTYASMYPGMPLGLSDHTPGHATVLGAVALGARCIEKHFTDDNGREGPDHKFAMNPRTWKEMVQRTRELEAALGQGVKRVEENEKETVILQRRAIRAARDIDEGHTLAREDLEVLRPCPPDGLPPFRLHEVIGKRARHRIGRGKHLTWTDLG